MRATVIEFTLAFLICWIGAAVLSGCMIDQRQAYQIIQGVE